MNVRARRFPLLDSVRAIAAIIVVAAHVAGPSGADRPGTFAEPFITRASIAPALFFVVSGFLLYRPFVRARLLDRPRQDLRSYALGRVLRVVPAYWVALTLITIWHDKPLVFGDQWWAFYLFGQIYIGEPLGGIPAVWSLCIEIAFYVMLPFFALAVAKLPGRTFGAKVRGEVLAIGALIFVALLTRGIVGADGLSLETAVDVAPITFFDWCAYGMLIAVFTVWLEGREEKGLPRWAEPFARWPGILWGAAILAMIGDALYFDGKIYEYTLFENYLEHLVFGFVAFAVVAPLTFGDQRVGWTRRLIDNRPLLYLGLVSYGVFLWHEAVIQQLVKWDLGQIDFIHPYVLWLGVALLLSMAIGTVSYYVLERPAMNLRRRILGARAVRPRDEALGADEAPAAPHTARDAHAAAPASK
jgi:peptidoglycan/LPS O-acetylase OafA/YrhL